MVAPYKLFRRPYNPPTPTFTRELGSALDAECKALVLKPVGLSINAGASSNSEWRETIDQNGRAVWVLGRARADSASGLFSFD